MTTQTSQNPKEYHNIFINNTSSKNWRFEQFESLKVRFERYEKLDFTKIKDLYVSKDIVKKVKIQPIEWEGASLMVV